MLPAGSSLLRRAQHRWVPVHLELLFLRFAPCLQLPDLSPRKMLECTGPGAAQLLRSQRQPLLPGPCLPGLGAAAEVLWPHCSSPWCWAEPMQCCSGVGMTKPTLSPVQLSLTAPSSLSWMEGISCISVFLGIKLLQNWNLRLHWFAINTNVLISSLGLVRPSACSSTYLYVFTDSSTFQGNSSSRSTSK